MTEAMHQILVVEDDDGIRNVLRVLLEAENYRVVEAETARRAEIEARSHKPDLLLVDLGLPDGDGIEVIKARARLVAGADRRAVGAHAGSAEDRGARCRRRRLRDEAVQRPRAARARARGLRRNVRGTEQRLDGPRSATPRSISSGGAQRAPTASCT